MSRHPIESFSDSLETPDPPISQILERKQEQDNLLRALGTLSPKNQEVVRLRLQDDLSYKEISEITGLSVSNIGFILHKALSHIVSELAESQEAEAQQGGRK